MCSAQRCWRPNTNGIQARQRSCWKMKMRIRFPLPTNFSRGANGKSMSNGCATAENLSLRSAAVVSTSRAKICAHQGCSDGTQAAGLCVQRVCNPQNGQRTECPLGAQVIDLC